MGEAKQRAAQIAELKKTPRGPNKRRKLILRLNREFKVPHFRNAAARAAALDVIEERGIRNSTDMANAVNEKKIEPKLVHPVLVRVFDALWKEKPPRQPKKAEQLVLVVGRKLSLEERFTHTLALAQRFPAGFRQPSAKAKNWQSTSLIERLSIAMGISKPRTSPEQSDRGKKKAAAIAEAKATIVLDRLLAQWPDRVTEAKTNERLVNWFVAVTEELLETSVNRDWLRNLVKERVNRKPRDITKYMHAAERLRRQAAEEFGVADIMTDGQVYALPEAA